MANSGLLGTIRDNLTALGLEVDDGPDPTVLSFDTTGTSGEWTTYIWLRADEGEVVVHGVVPFAVPNGRREEIALFITRANFGLILGNFELDLEDGELRFKTSIDYGSSDLDLEMLRRHVATSLRTIDRYLPGVVEVIDGKNALSAVQSVERTGN